jgi:peptidoglycan hydrolase-like protein with peptidoglycan-binding domain
MSIGTKRSHMVAGTIGALAAVTLVLSASPASASNSYNGRAYVYGADAWHDDWYDEGILSTSSNTSSNATCLWQKILWADGLISSSAIDGVFGSGTRTATETWQAQRSQPVDGVVGKDTFKFASYNAADWDLDGAVDHYNGAKYPINMTRDSAGRYNFYDGDGNARLAGYDYRTCS